MRREPRHLRVEQLEQLEVDIAKGVPNHRLMSTYRMSYEQLRTFIYEMNYTPDPDARRFRRPTAPCGTETAFDRHRRQRVHCEICEEAHAVLLARRSATRRAARARQADQRRTERDAAAAQRAEIDADRRIRGVA